MSKGKESTKHEFVITILTNSSLVLLSILDVKSKHPGHEFDCDIAAESKAKRSTYECSTMLNVSNLGKLVHKQSLKRTVKELFLRDVKNA